MVGRIACWVFFSCPGQLNNWHCLSVCPLVGLSEPTNNQSLEIRIAMETNTTAVKVRNTLVIVDIVVWLLVGSDQGTDRQTMSVIELSWTAKNAFEQS